MHMEDRRRIAMHIKGRCRMQSDFNFKGCIEPMLLRVRCLADLQTRCLVNPGQYGLASLTRTYSSNPILNRTGREMHSLDSVVPNYPSASLKELMQDIPSPTAISLGLGQPGAALHVRCYNCGQMGHISYDCTFPQVRKACYTCGNHGHLSRDCPQKKKLLVCYTCRQVGHITMDCPSKTKDGAGAAE